MKIKHILGVGVMSLGMLSLSACSTGRHTSAPVSDATPGSATAGYGSGAGFAGANNNNSAKMRVGNQSYYFDLNQDNVHQSDYASIGVQAQYASTHPSAHLRLEGNTDNRGSREYNMALGLRRANAVKSVLMQDGVAGKQITTFSWGAEKPVASGNNEQAWSQNRRVDLIYKSK